MSSTQAHRESREEFERLFAGIAGLAYTCACRLVPNREDAMDLIQDACVQAYTGFKSFEPGTNFKAWYLKILTNRFLKTRGQEQRRTSAISLDDVHDTYLFAQTQKAGLPQADHDPAEVVLGKMTGETVQSALDRLPDDFRDAAVLYFVADLKYDEIADILGCPVGTIRSRLHRGRKLLQVELWDLAVANGIVPVGGEQ